MNSSDDPPDCPIQTTEQWRFGSLSLILVVGKLIGLWGGSWGWLFSGRLQVLLVFAAFEILSLWRYWSRIGHLLNEGDDCLC